MTDQKNIVILGAAESGVGAALLAQAKGHTVFVSDRGTIQPDYKQQLTQAGIAFEENQHTLDRILQADEVVKSPGIPEKAPVIQALREKQIPVISEIEFAGRYTRAKCICITGTNGKTTTTLLTYHLLKEAGLRVGLAGNVGFSLAEQVIEDKFDYYVVELSSFQLDDTQDFQPWVAILLNITPDHLDRYGYSLENYAQAKLRITRNLDSSGAFIYNADDEVTGKYFQSAFMAAQQLPFSLHHRPDAWLAGYYTGEDTLCTNLAPGLSEDGGVEISIARSPLIGQHNRQNTLAAVLAARVAGLEAEQIEAALATFRNADHRLQLVGEINGARYINDSKATNVEAAWYALDGIHEPIIWIAGGTDKGNDYSSLLSLAEHRVKALICLGVDNTKLHTTFDPIVPHVEETQSMKDAVQRAAALAAPGDVVLLSPCCASFDLFKNYEDRGRQFAAAVGELGNEGKKVGG
ncbi:UDP-N-acetylmuramoyl-L-alanine--D-glutamate ligase [Hymenobacter properus]|uniref:UDP-N-acetylmuramoylalanine--D-glutamate ligase n=1 Tax=Hymenobacter properus TaxID=2791026 RepID=A0A931FI88_9BACT|nr:UDP-N-acetylmuramoyl-L-alanine--D-glutamate ligase [Hymenobacter properus]MBF9140518.1 UDP-N-acetylmuramoyl-L-alanine--D-glutamate ligase [Hymenobacter properus]MBR7719325.1 UDP-N-acetylmuramoyl-L-alanine--D-glutamate ligase [Microvirga sp. SRT04]